MSLVGESVTISDLAPLLRRKELSPVELTHRYLERAKRLNPLLNAYLTLTEEQALADAKRAEREIERGEYRGPLHGIPFSIKDNLATQGVRTTAGSKILADWIPDHDATAVKRLKEAGAIVLGKANMHEWALGGTTILFTARHIIRGTSILSPAVPAAARALPWRRICASLRSAPTARNRCAILRPCAASSASNRLTGGSVSTAQSPAPARIQRIIPVS